MTTPWNGTWDVSWVHSQGENVKAELTIEVHPNGHGTGTYTYQNGTVDGGFTRGGKVFEGEWIQGNYRGYFAFILTSDTTFYGVWANSQDADAKPWTGKKRQ